MKFSLLICGFSPVVLFLNWSTMVQGKSNRTNLAWPNRWLEVRPFDRRFASTVNLWLHVRSLQRVAYYIMKRFQWMHCEGSG